MCGGAFLFKFSSFFALRSHPMENPEHKATESKDSLQLLDQGLGEDLFTCPVCTEILYKPVTTPCGHTFCELCLSIALSHKPRCPICREVCPLSFSQLKVNVLLVSLLEYFCKDQYTKRGMELAKQENTLQSTMKRVLIGNTHELLQVSSHNKHKWRFFCIVLGMDERLGENIQTSTADYVQKVEVFLHPTFTPSQIVLTQQPFEFARIGWGSFMLRGKVYFHEKFRLPPLAFDHQLSFDRNGTHRAYTVNFRE